MRVAVLVSEGAFDSGLSTISDVLGTANDLRGQMDRPPPAWEVSLVGFRRTVRTARGHLVRTVPAAAVAPDVLAVVAVAAKDPTALSELVSARAQRRALDLIAAARAGEILVAGACTATFLLAEAGVLDGQRATTSWWLGPAFRARYSSVELDTRESLVVGNKVITAGAAMAHIDLALCLVQQQSPALADLVARYLLIGERASQAAFAVPATLARHSPEVAAFERWVREHLGEPLQIADAAAAVGVSERTLQRRTAQTLGMTPLEFVNEIRLEEAVHLLRSTASSVEVIAAKVGLRNASSLRRLIRDRRAVGVRALRATGAGRG